MYAALTFEEAKQRTLVPKQVVGLAAALLTGAAITPMNVQAVQNMAVFGSAVSSPADSKKDTAAGGPSANLKIMEEKAGVQSGSGFNVASIRLIDEEEKIIQIRNKIVSSVLSWKGINYKWGGRTKAGVDCSGLVQRIFREQGIQLPRTSYEQFREGVGIPKAKLEPGDLVFFNTNGAGASHVGIYLGNGQFISATKSCVEVQSLDHPYWTVTYRGSRRVIC